MVEITFKDVSLNYNKFPLKSNWCDSQLKDQNFVAIGTGKYSRVFHREGDDFVIKINIIPDDANAAYIKLCMEKTNKYFPKVFQYNAVMAKTRYYNKPFTQNIVFMEKLNRISNTDVASDISNKIQGAIYAYKNNEEIPKINATLKSACNDIAIVGKSSRDFWIDVHEANIMYRGRQVVITDPLCM